MSDLDLDAIEQQARRGLELFPDHDPYRVTGISAGYALDLVAEIMRLRDEVAEVRERIAAEIESAGRAEVDFLGRTIENKADRYRAIGSEDAWKAAARIARGQT